jgi:hypothetical protein
MGDLPAVASGDGWVLPMSDGLTRTQGQEARATADIRFQIHSPALAAKWQALHPKSGGGESGGCERLILRSNQQPAVDRSANPKSVGQRMPNAASGPGSP